MVVYWPEIPVSPCLWHANIPKTSLPVIRIFRIRNGEYNQSKITYRIGVLLLFICGAALTDRGNLAETACFLWTTTKNLFQYKLNPKRRAIMLDLGAGSFL